MREQVKKKIMKGIPVEDIAEMLEESIETIQNIVCEIKSAKGASGEM